MTEVLLAIVITTLAAAGMALGLMLGRGPARTSCGASECLPRGRCDECPMRRREAG
ncbi:hypothetical protein [Vannielia litorea]|uniref:Uncharacterized protein n=1 Tax=Vannielia litorea TaxID=1217970 RepID=A0A1N6E209_9RHOB|nr:hypothetical protein [Vannielia litorea]SIN77068.1 hypothetical protein SAMN05444002_0250 [Vannielia litorea]